MSGFNSVNQGFLGGGAGGSGPATTVPISGLLAATASNNINNGNFNQQWYWDSLSGSTGLTIGSNSTASVGEEVLVGIFMSGGNVNDGITTYGLQVTNSHSFGEGGGDTCTNIAFRAQSTGVNTNIAAWFNRGRVDFGTIGVESGVLNINGATSGAITIKPQNAAGTYNFNLPITAGAAGQFLTSGGGGSTAMTWSSPSAPSVSGTANEITSTGGTTPVLALASGGTLPGNWTMNGTIGTVTPSTGAFTTGGFTGLITSSANGAASTPAISITGNPSTAGTTTTDYPLVYRNGGTAPTTWNTNGTYDGWNAVSGFTGNFLDFHVNGGTSVASLDYTGVLITAGRMQNTETRITGGGTVYFNDGSGNYSRIYGSGIADGVIRLTGNGGATFDRLILGSNSTSFPAIARNGTGIDIKLADNSAYTNITSATHSLLGTSTTGKDLSITNSTLTTGSAASIALTGTAAASNTKTGLTITSSGANATASQTVTGQTISVTNTGTTNTNVGLTIDASGASTRNTAIQVTSGIINFATSGTAALPNIKFGASSNATGFYDAGVNNINVVANGNLSGSWGDGASATTGFWIRNTGNHLRLVNATYLTSPSDAVFKFGLADAAAPVAQNLKIQNVVVGTSNTAGVNLTIDGSQGTGTGVGGSILFRTAAAGSTGTAVNALSTTLTISPTAITAALPVTLMGYTVATLPTGVTGMMAYVTDATLPTYNAALVGGGAVVVPVFYNGAAWVSH